MGIMEFGKGERVMQELLVRVAGIDHGENILDSHSYLRLSAFCYRVPERDSFGCST